MQEALCGFLAGFWLHVAGFKAAQINTFTLTTDQMTTCNLREISCSKEPTENSNLTSLLISTDTFLIFGFLTTKMHYFGLVSCQHVVSVV